MTGRLQLGAVVDDALGAGVMKSAGRNGDGFGGVSLSEPQRGESCSPAA